MNSKYPNASIVFNVPHCIVRLLVEWNYAIFDTFVPRAWAKLLSALVKGNEIRPDIWSAWPRKISEDDANASSYWGNMSQKLLKEVLSAHLEIFPTSSPNCGVPSHVSLESALVAAPSDDPAVIAALARTGIPLVQPPKHIYCLLEKSDFIPVTPVHVHEALLVRFGYTC